MLYMTEAGERCLKGCFRATFDTSMGSNGSRQMRHAHKCHSPPQCILETGTTPDATNTRRASKTLAHHVQHLSILVKAHKEHIKGEST